MGYFRESIAMDSAQWLYRKTAIDYDVINPIFAEN